LATDRADDSGLTLAGDKAIPAGYKWWLIGSVAVLVGSLVLFTTAVVAGFVYFSAKATPLWVTVLAVISVLGIGVGFLGLFGIFVAAAMKARKG
jgi:hypothetical protein